MIPEVYFLFLLFSVFLTLSSTSLQVSAQSSATSLINPYNHNRRGTNSSLRSFSETGDSSSLRIVSAFDYSGVLIVKTALYFNVENFKRSVIESLPELTLADPSQKKLYEDNFLLLEYCTWATNGSIPNNKYFRPSCETMTSHDWETLVSRMSLEGGVSICHDTLERSATGNFAITPFNNKSGSELSYEQQTLIRFSFNGAISQAALSQLSPQRMGACQLALSQSALGTDGATRYAFSSNVLASHYDLPVVPRSKSLPTKVLKEIDRIKQLIMAHPVEAGSIGAIIVILFFCIVGCVGYRLWQNKLRREAFRQKQQTQQAPEEQARRMRENVDPSAEDPYKTRTGGINNDDGDDREMAERNSRRHHEETSSNNNTILDMGDLALEEAIRNARSNFKKVADNVSTMLGIPRDGDHPVAQHDDDDDVAAHNNPYPIIERRGSFQQQQQQKHSNSGGSISTASSEDVQDSLSPKQRRNETDIFNS